MPLALLGFLLVAGFQEFDVSKVDRKILSEPAYVAAPRYALLLLGGEGKTRVWIALDKSKAELPYYDVVYLDRDADGRLGEEGEKRVGTRNENNYVISTFEKLEFADAGLKLEDFQVYSQFARRKNPTVWIKGRVNGKVTLYGGYGSGGGITEGAGTPEKAPVLRLDPFGTLEFHHAHPGELKRGEPYEVMLYVGTRGSGPATFLAVDEHFLDPGKDRIFATLIARDSRGEEIRERVQLKEHC